MDWIHIIGGGMAGLSLAAKLAEYKKLPGNVVISEPNTSCTINQTFCYWERKEESFKQLRTKSFDSWVFSTKTESTSHYGESWEYNLLRGQTFFEDCMDKIKKNPSIKIIPQKLDRMPKAYHVFDSRPPLSSSFRVFQSIYGLELFCKKGHKLDPSAAILMGDMRTAGEDFLFNYLLPLDEQRLIFEATAFGTKRVPKKRLLGIIESFITQYGVEAEITGEEGGYIPMGLKAAPLDNLGFPIGARGDMARNSSGYSFLAVQTWAKLCAESLVENDSKQLFVKNLLEKSTDDIFLRIIEKDVKTIPNIIFSMANSMSGDCFAEFMTEVKFNNFLSVIAAVPKVPFLRSLLVR